MLRRHLQPWVGRQRLRRLHRGLLHGRESQYTDSTLASASQTAVTRQGATCQPCPQSLLLLIPVGLAALVGIGIVVYLIWRVSAVQLSDDSTKSSRDVADAEDNVALNAKAAAATAKESLARISNTAQLVTPAARISNTAIISSIAFPSIFQISITFEMPFGFPPVLVQFAEWVTSVVSLDLGQVGSPECAMDNNPEMALLFKFLLTVSPRT